MSWRLEFSPTAESEILEAARFIAEDSPTDAVRWYDGIYEAIMSLQDMPNRCSHARENEAFPIELRQMVFKSHRVIFSIHSDVVRIHRVLHGAQDSAESL